MIGWGRLPQNCAPSSLTVVPGAELSYAFGGIVAGIGSCCRHWPPDRRAVPAGWPVCTPWPPGGSVSGAVVRRRRRGGGVNEDQ